MEESTTANATDNSGVSSTQPEAVAEAAVNPQPEATAHEPSVDENSEWLRSKGIDPSSPEAIAKLAAMARNSEQMMTKATQRASELEKSLNQPVDVGQSSMEEFIQDYRRDKMISSFKESTPDWSSHEGKMTELLTEQVNTPYGVFTRSQLVNEGLLTLQDVYAMAKGASPVNTEDIKRNAQNEVLQTLANSQRAGGANTHATNSLPTPKDSDPVTEAIRKARG